MNPTLSRSPARTACPRPEPTRAALRRQAGFTLIELMVAVAVVGILAAIAMPSYSRYMMRSRSLVALTTLSSAAIGLEQRFQDVGAYPGTPNCGLPTSVANFSIGCEVGTATNPAGFLITAVGSGLLSGITYTIDDAGVHSTPEHPYGRVLGCWTIRGGTCDS